MAKKPKGYYSKGKVTSEKAALRAKYGNPRSLKGIAGIVGGAIIEGIGGPKAKAAGAVVKGAAKLARPLTQAETELVRRASRKLATRNKTQMSRKGDKIKVSPSALNQKAQPVRKTARDKEAAQVAVESVRSRYGRTRTVAKPNSGRGLSKSEKARDAYYKSKQNPVTTRRTEPKKKSFVSKEEKEMLRQYEIRKAMRGGKGGKRAALPKGKTNVSIDKPKRTMGQVMDPLKGKKVKTGTSLSGKPMYMDAQEYLLTKAKARLATQNPKNSVAPRTRMQEKARADKAEKLSEKEARREQVLARLQNIRQISAAKANPKRYTTSSQEYGNVRQTEGLVAQGEARIQQETARRAIEREKIANTPRAKKQVEATLQKAKERDEARLIAARMAARREKARRAAQRKNRGK